MHKRDLDENIESGRSRDMGDNRDRMRGGSSGSDRMRDIDEMDMPESSEDLERKQREGHLGNERVRGRSMDDDM